MGSVRNAPKRLDFFTAAQALQMQLYVVSCWLVAATDKADKEARLRKGAVLEKVCNVL